MSQDKVWDQFNLGSTAAESGAEKPLKPNEGGDIGGVDADILAQWLTMLPPNESLIAPTAVAAQSVPGAAAELSNLWPPAAPVDPFAALAGPDAAGSSAAPAWDLNFEPKPAAAPEPPPYSPPPPPVAAPVAPPPVAVSPSVLDDFDLGAGMGGPAPLLTAPPTPSVAPITPVSPFGPPPPPVAPPQEALQAAPLKLRVTIGRRTLEVNVRGEALIGRVDTTRGIHPEVDLRQDDAVSRRHAKIFIRNGRYVLTDLNSTNGTRHNSNWVQPESEVPLNVGDEIEIGELSLIKVLEAPQSHA